MSAPPSVQAPQQDTLSMFNLSHFSSSHDGSLAVASSLPPPVATMNYHSAPALEENLWLATVSQQQAETTTGHSVAPQISAPLSLEPSPPLSLSHHPSTSDASEENHTPELLSLSDSLNDLSVSAEPYVYMQGGDATASMILHQIN
jgi:hypothetical protein